jgi:hypothetical protein
MRGNAARSDIPILQKIKAGKAEGSPMGSDLEAVLQTQSANEKVRSS